MYHMIPGFFLLQPHLYVIELHSPHNDDEINFSLSIFNFTKDCLTRVNVSNVLLCQTNQSLWVMTKKFANNFVMLMSPLQVNRLYWYRQFCFDRTTHLNIARQQTGGCAPCIAMLPPCLAILGHPRVPTESVGVSNLLPIANNVNRANCDLNVFYFPFLVSYKSMKVSCNCTKTCCCLNFISSPNDILPVGTANTKVSLLMNS